MLLYLLSIIVILLLKYRSCTEGLVMNEWVNNYTENPTNYPLEIDDYGIFYVEDEGIVLEFIPRIASCNSDESNSCTLSTDISGDSGSHLGLSIIPCQGNIDSCTRGSPDWSGYFLNYPDNVWPFNNTKSWKRSSEGGNRSALLLSSIGVDQLRESSPITNYELVQLCAESCSNMPGCTNFQPGLISTKVNKLGNMNSTYYNRNQLIDPGNMEDNDNSPCKLFKNTNQVYDPTGLPFNNKYGGTYNPSTDVLINQEPEQWVNVIHSEWIDDETSTPIIKRGRIEYPIFLLEKREVIDEVKKKWVIEGISKHGIKTGKIRKWWPSIRFEDIQNKFNKYCKGTSCTVNTNGSFLLNIDGIITNISSDNQLLYHELNHPTEEVNETYSLDQSIGTYIGFFIGVILVLFIIMLILGLIREKSKRNKSESE